MYFVWTHSLNSLSFHSKVKHLDAAAPFPDSDDKDTLYVKLSWDSKTFEVVDAALVESLPAPASSPPPHPKPSLPPSPPCSPPAAATVSQGLSRRALPTPDPTIMRKAASGEVRYSRATMSAGKSGPIEAESLHSATKLSASKCLSAKRRNATARTPGVRKKLELNSECLIWDMFVSGTSLTSDTKQYHYNETNTLFFGSLIWRLCGIMLHHL